MEIPEKFIEKLRMVLKRPGMYKLEDVEGLELLF